MSTSKKIARKSLRTAIRDLDSNALRSLSHAELRLVAGGGSAGASTNHGGAGASDDIATVEEQF
jgi:hypothetical protein